MALLNNHIYILLDDRKFVSYVRSSPEDICPNCAHKIWHVRSYIAPTYGKH